MQAVPARTMGANLDIASIARDHYEIVYRFCARRVGLQAAADVAQETFLSAQKALHKFRGESTLRTWLLGIANNECRRMSRSKKPEMPEIELGEIAGADPLEATLIDRYSLQEALNKLSPEHREVVLLHEVEGLSYEEAALVIGVPPGTVKSRLHHAFLNLRRSLQGFQVEA